MTATSTLVHFSVTGEFITKQARAFWADEDAPERALDLLRALHGITDQQCLDIVEGRAKLTGDSNVGIGIEADNMKLPTLQDQLKRLKAEREEAREDCADLVQMINGDTVIVGSPTGPRSIPYRQSKEGTSRTANRRGIRDGRDFDDIDDSLKNPGDKPLRIWRQEKPFTLDQYKANQAASARQAVEVKLPPLKPDKTITSDNGWLSPEGDFYGCQYGDHNEVAYRLKLDYYDLMAKGWVKLQCTGDDDELSFFREDYDEKVTTQQAEMIREHCGKWNLEIPWWLEKTS